MRSFALGKNPTFYISILAGVLSGIWSYGYWLPAFFARDSARIFPGVLGVALVVSILTFFLSIKFIIPGIESLATPSKQWFWTICLFSGFFVYLSTINFQYLQTKYLYILLPTQSLEIKGISASSRPGENIQLRRVAISEGDVSFYQMNFTGWKRDEQGYKKLVLVNNGANRIAWTGKTFGKAVLYFDTSPAGGKVDISWNGIHTTYDLTSKDAGILEIPQYFQVPVYAGWIPLGAIMVVGFSLGICILFLLTMKLKARRKTPAPQKLDWIWFALPMLITWVFYLVVFYPGFMTNDSFTQWQQMVTGSYVNWHPPFHTMTNWLITRAWYSPAAVALAQIIALSGVLGWGVAVIRRAGTPAWLCWLTSILLAIFPADGTLVITLWKDIFFTTAVTALSILVFMTVRSNGKWVSNGYRWVILGVVYALIALYSQSGIIISSGTALALIFAYRAFWKKYVFGLALFLAIFGLVKVGLFGVIKVAPSDSSHIQYLLLDVVAAHKNAGTPLLPDETAFVKKIYPEDHLPYNCYRNLEIRKLANEEELKAGTWQLVKLVMDLTLRAPSVTISRYACNGAFVYRMFENLWDYDTAYLSIGPNDFGFKPVSFIPALRPLMSNFIIDITMDQNGEFNWIFWRSPFWMFLLITGMFCTGLRKNKWIDLLVILPVMLAVLPLIFISLGQIFRYVFPMYLCGILFSGYYWTTAASIDEVQS